MRFVEFNPNHVDTCEIFNQLVEQEAKKDRVLYESSGEVVKYQNIIQKYQQYNIDPSNLIVGNGYYPITFIATPTNTSIQIYDTNEEAIFHSKHLDRLFFMEKLSGKQFSLPLNFHRSMGPMKQDSFVFDSERIKYIMLTEINLTLSHWSIYK